MPPELLVMGEGFYLRWVWHGSKSIRDFAGASSGRDLLLARQHKDGAFLCRVGALPGRAWRGGVFGLGPPGLGGGCGFLSVDEPVPQAFQVQFLQDGFGPFPGVAAGAAGFAGDDQLVLHGVFPAH